MTQVCDQCLRKHEALVGLHRQVNERQHSRTVIGHGERAQSQCRLQFEQMFAARLVPLCVIRPERRRDADMFGNELQQRRRRLDTCAQDDAGVAHATELDGKAQAVGRATVLTDQRQFRFAERVVADEVIAAIRKRKEAVALGGRENGTSWHRGSTEDGDGAEMDCGTDSTGLTVQKKYSLIRSIVIILLMVIAIFIR